jgi:hypothetical protein
VGERKPAGVSFESWVDKQIRKATERGDFDNLPGAGKPLPGRGRPYEEHWWLRNYLRKEGLSAESLLPTSLRLRKEQDQIAEAVRELPSEQAVRELVNELNQRILEYLRAPSGPQVQVNLVDTDVVIKQWRAHRTAIEQDAADTSAALNQMTATKPKRARWWSFIPRRRNSGD